MVRQVNKIRQLFIITFVCYVISALSLGVIPFIPENVSEEQNIINYVISSLFWFGLLAGLITIKIIATKIRKNRRKLLPNGHFDHHARPGIISFSGKPWHLVLYIITCMGIAAVIIDLIYHCIPQFFMFPIIAVTFLSFAVHCIIDGKYFKTYIVIKEGIKNEHKN